MITALIDAEASVAAWIGAAVAFVLGLAAGALPAVLAVLWGYLTLRRGLRRPTIE